MEEKTYFGRKMKYVMNNKSGKFIIFPESISHDTVESRGLYEYTSAGFLQFYSYENNKGVLSLGVDCYGKSESLNLSSDEELDSMIITNSLRERD